ncbi:MAG TPA: GNAT family N-acetyltransferase [Polyangiaceae bacterium]|nr:GNAT family N-acetyltransferase [Polyangiaceae bacterium]
MQNPIALEPNTGRLVVQEPVVAGVAPVAPTAPEAEPFALRMASGGRAWANTVAEWRTLTRRAPPMLTPEFMLLTARLVGADDVALFGARRGGSLCAALPLVRRGRTLVALRSDHTPRFDFAGDAACVPAVWRAVRDEAGWDVLDLRGIPCDSALAKELPELARGDGCRAVVQPGNRAPWFEMAGIEQRIHRRFRGDMRRLERQMGGVELERVTVFDRAALDEVLRLEAAAWKGAAGTAIACDERLTHFYRALARVFARRGALNLAFLRANGRRIAAQFALEDATTHYLMKTGYDPEYAHFGPGQLLVRETAADAARRGLVRYDLLGKDTPWKMKWTSSVREHVDIRIYAPTLRGRARHFTFAVARPMVGRARRALLAGARGPGRQP